MKRSIIVLLALVLLVAAACGGDDDSNNSSDGGEPGDLRDATLVLNWTPNAHHLGVYAAQQLEWYRDAGIDLKIVEPTEAGAEQVVGNGTAEFGVSVAENVIPARANGIPIVSIGTILPVNDSALMSLADDGITSPADLAGKTYGAYGGGETETEIINRLAKCGGVDPASIKDIEIGNVDYLAGLEANRFDVVWVFAGWDALRASEVEHKDVNLIRFDDELDCIPNWYTPLFITNEKLIEQDPDLVRAFMEVTARGYQLATDDPQQAAELMMKAVPEMDQALITDAASYYSTRFEAAGAPFGTQDDATWSSFEQFLEQSKAIETPVDVQQAYTNEFLTK